MNQHKLFLLVACLTSWHATAGDFACLQAMIPATDHFWVKNHRTHYSSPKVSPAGAIAISQWDQDKLLAIYVYTEMSSKKHDRFKMVGSDQIQEMKSISTDWLKSHRVAVKLDTFEVFDFQVEPPGGWDRKRLKVRETASAPEIGAWVVESTDQSDARTPIMKEIELRETWVKNNNLNAERFKAWSVAEKLCRTK